MAPPGYLGIKYNAMAWRKWNGEPLGSPMASAVEEALKRELSLGYRLKICIGCDSQTRGSGIDFATVIVILREGKGGFMFINRERLLHKLGIKARMLEEVTRAVNTAWELCPTLEKLDVDLEVHADINTNPRFKSHPALHEAMGYILSMGFAFKAKPHAFASSSCADKAL